MSEPLKDPKANEIVTLGKRVAKAFERDELLTTGKLRRALADFEAAVRWQERKDADA